MKLRLSLWSLPSLADVVRALVVSVFAVMCVKSIQVTAGCASAQPVIHDVDTGCTAVAVKVDDPLLTAICLLPEGLDDALTILLATPAGQPAMLTRITPSGASEVLHVDPEQVQPLVDRLTVAKRALVASAKK